MKASSLIESLSDRFPRRGAGWQKHWWASHQWHPAGTKVRGSVGPWVRGAVK